MTSVTLAAGPRMTQRSAEFSITYYTNVDSPVGRVCILATNHGLAALYFDRQKEEMERRFSLENRKPGCGNFWLLRAKAFTYRYFAGEVDCYPEIPLDVKGTVFQRSVWKTLPTISPASTSSYGEIAAQIGNPSASRAVGAAVGQNPVALIIPCHRVVGSTGELTGYAGGLELKRFLLEHERKHTVECPEKPLGSFAIVE